MTDDWAYAGEPARVAGATTGVVTLIDGVTFCICSPNGDVLPGSEQGLFFRDTRFLDRLELELDGTALDPLVVRRSAPHAAAFISRRPPRPGTADSTLLVVRRRVVGAGMLEEVTLRNLGREAAAIVLKVSLDADFAGIFEVKEGRVRRREPIERAVRPGAVGLSYRIGSDSRAVTVCGSGELSLATSHLLWHAVIPPREEWTTSIQVVPAIDDVEPRPRYAMGDAVELRAAAGLASWRRSPRSVKTADEGLDQLFEQSVEDLSSLRISDPESPDRNVIAAGAPWFMTLFGRDALLASWMLLPIDQSVALGTMQTLARLQGAKSDPVSEEEPGRVLHEVRAGLDATLALGGGNVYYGTADATPLFVMLLAEARRWGVSRADTDALLPHADRALAWIEEHGDRDGDGFVEYHRATDKGLVNQGWKDSFDGVTFASGQLAEPPIALAEVQGYSYAAYLARASLASELGDHEASAHWRSKASELKRRFNEAFWLADRGYLALGLDGDKRPIDSLASNMGHCLWTGIVDDDKASIVADRLLGDDMFTGFGVRTLAASMGAYNPMSYHNGSVWPHDNAIVAAGLMRYGFVEAAQRVAGGIFDAGRCLGGRLPELFCGFARSDFDEPVPYPTSCYPQAWAAAAPLLLLRTLLRLDADVPGRQVRYAPAVPKRYLPLRVERLRLGGTQFKCEVSPLASSLEGLPPEIELEPARTSSR